jgi:hypothetical protein
MVSHLHVLPMRPLRKWPMLSAWTTIALALVMYAVVLALRVADTNVGDAEGVFFVMPIGLLALRFGFRGGISGAVLAAGLVVGWGELDKAVHLEPIGYATRTGRS